MSTTAMAKMSVRGQVAIPIEIRTALGLVPGDRILFHKDGPLIIMGKADLKTFRELSEPLRKLPKKIQEHDVTGAIHELRKKWRDEGMRPEL